MSESIKFTLLLCTLNRADTIGQCLESIRLQCYTNYEVIVVDQSADNLTKAVCDRFQDISIIYCQVPFRGLSRARNYGLKHAEGDYVCLIDDDAVYSPDYLQTAEAFLCKVETPVILCGQYRYLDKREVGVVDYSIYENEQSLSINEVFRIGYSASLILPRMELVRVGCFDEDFGVGAEFGSGEETDLILRLTGKDIQVFFVEKMIFYHGCSEEAVDENVLKKTFSYFRGNGALVKKHLFLNKDMRVFPKFLRLTVGAMIKWLIGNKQQKIIYSARIRGFTNGFFLYRKNPSV